MTRAQFDLLEFSESQQRLHCSPAAGLFTGRTARKSVAEQCVALGWLTRSSLLITDDDGWAKEDANGCQHERSGYVLTNDGAIALAAERSRREVSP